MDQDAVKGPVMSKEEELIEQIKSLQGEELLKVLQNIHPSDVYKILRDHLTKQHIDSMKATLELNKAFQQLKELAKSQWDHDHKLATMMDVDRAATRVYGIVLKMIRELNNNSAVIAEAVNRIEDHLGIPKTSWIAEPQPDVQTPAVEEAPADEPKAEDEGNVNP